MYTTLYPIPMTPFEIFNLLGLILIIAGAAGAFINAWKDQEPIAALCLGLFCVGVLMAS